MTRAIAHQQLKVRVYDTYSKGTLEDDLTGRYTALSFSTALHGGFTSCRLFVPMTLGHSWLYLRRENLLGRHFHHLEIVEDKRVVWEGRIMDTEIVIRGGEVGLQLDAYGYYSSLRDQYYSASDAGNTDWTSGTHYVSDIIKELLTKACPSISTDQSQIASNSRNVGGIVLTAREYPQDVIVDKLAPLADTGLVPWYFAVWEDRVPYWKARSASTVDWYLWLRDCDNITLRQQGIDLRNYVLPVTGTAEGTGTVDAESTAAYVRREMKLSLGPGVPIAAANDARDAAIADRRYPSQTEAFTISGHVYSTRTTGFTPQQMNVTTGAMVERPKWWVRAGDVLRIQDLMPASASTPGLDRLRTFFILETSYDAMTDILTIQPDRPPQRLDVLLPRIEQLESNK